MQSKNRTTCNEMAERVASRKAKRRGTIEHIARAFSATVAARSLMCRLTSIFPSILERNISAERMVGFKYGLLSGRKEAALDFHCCMPSISASTFEKFIHQALPLLIGLWPQSNPAKAHFFIFGVTGPQLAASLESPFPLYLAQMG
jgi:hypothetical protein